MEAVWIVMNAAGGGVRHGGTSAAALVAVLAPCAIGAQLAILVVTSVGECTRPKPNIPQVVLAQIAVCEFVGHGETAFDPAVAHDSEGRNSGAATAPAVVCGKLCEVTTAI